jgi:hypothetical protein
MQCVVIVFYLWDKYFMYILLFYLCNCHVHLRFVNAVVYLFVLCVAPLSVSVKLALFYVECRAPLNDKLNFITFAGGFHHSLHQDNCGIIPTQSWKVAKS